MTTIDGVGEGKKYPTRSSERGGRWSDISRHYGVRDYRAQLVGSVIDSAQILPRALALLQRRQIRRRADEVERRCRWFRRRAWLARIFGNSKVQKRMPDSIHIHLQQVCVLHEKEIALVHISSLHKVYGDAIFPCTKQLKHSIQRDLV